MSDSFTGILLRLKERTGLVSDKEVAELLGMSDKAFAARKTRAAFPSDRLRALAEKRPDLGLDVGYVLNGLNAADVSAMLAGFGGRLRELRGDMPAGEFAKGLGIDEGHLQRVESGTEMPSTRMIKEAITTHKAADPVWLLSGKRQKVAGELSLFEVVLVNNYRAADATGKGAISHLAAYFAQPDPGPDEG